MFFHSKRHSPIERTRIAGGIGEHAQGGEWERARVGSGVPIEWEGKARACAVWVFEAGQVDPHTPIEVGIGRHVLHELLFVGDVHCVNPRVRIVLTEYRYADKRGKRPGANMGLGTVFGYVGNVTWSASMPPAIDCCCTPFVVIGPTCVSMFCRALKMPQLARRADFPSPRMSQANPTRGWNNLFWFGKKPVDGKAGLLRYWP